jgi:hypothetical protein
VGYRNPKRSKAPGDTARAAGEVWGECHLPGFKYLIKIIFTSLRGIDYNRVLGWGHQPWFKSFSILI